MAWPGSGVEGFSGGMEGYYNYKCRMTRLACGGREISYLVSFEGVKRESEK